MKNLNNAPDPKTAMSRTLSATFTGKPPVWESGVNIGVVMEDYEIRIENAIAGIMESNRKIKEIDAKINARVKEIKKTGIMNIGELYLLRRML